MSWLDDLCSRLKREPGVSADIAERVVSVIAAEYGGERVYIPQRQRPEIQPSDTPQQIVQRYQVSRSTAYSWVRHWRR